MKNLQDKNKTHNLPLPLLLLTLILLQLASMKQTFSSMMHFCCEQVERLLAFVLGQVIMGDFSDIVLTDIFHASTANGDDQDEEFLLHNGGRSLDNDIQVHLALIRSMERRRRARNLTMLRSKFVYLPLDLRRCVH